MKFEVGDGRAVRGRDDPVGMEGVQLVNARAQRWCKDSKDSTDSTATLDSIVSYTPYKVW